MKGELRVVVALAFLIGLTGCNLVVSEEPWFTAADAVPEPILRDGLWLQAEPGCRVDPAKPAERWPQCAHATFVRGKEQWTMQWEQSDGGRRRRTFVGWESNNVELSDALLIPNGDHLIVQVPPKEPGQTTEEGEPRLYTYAAIHPVRHDDQGKVIAMDIWLVQCGRLSQQKPAKERRHHASRDDDVEAGANYVTDRPFPGLTVVDYNCVATNVDALRNAAALSGAMGLPNEMRWLRDGWR